MRDWCGNVCVRACVHACMYLSALDCHTSKPQSQQQPAGQDSRTFIGGSSTRIYIQFYSIRAQMRIDFVFVGTHTHMAGPTAGPPKPCSQYNADVDHWTGRCSMYTSIRWDILNEINKHVVRYCHQSSVVVQTDWGSCNEKERERKRNRTHSINNTKSVFRI